MERLRILEEIKSTGSGDKQRSRQTLNKYPRYPCDTRITGTYILFVDISFADSLLKVYACLSYML